jgi:hypothetical protein
MHRAAAGKTAIIFILMLHYGRRLHVPSSRYLNSVRCWTQLLHEMSIKGLECQVLKVSKLVNR